MKLVLSSVFLVNTLITLWYGMMLTHETGHILAALATGGHIDYLAFPALGFSRTEISDNPHPLIVAWGGPGLGSILPLIATFALRPFKIRTHLLDLFTGFCLLANGIYIAIGSFDKIGDAGDLLRHGSPIWTLWLFGGLAIVAGMAVWHSLGRSLGMRTRWRPSDGRIAIICSAFLLCICILATHR